jgi:hypothetical protein
MSTNSSNFQSNYNQAQLNTQFPINQLISMQNKSNIENLDSTHSKNDVSNESREGIRTISLKTIVIIGVVIAILAALLVIIFVVVANKHKKKSNVFHIWDDETEKKEDTGLDYEEAEKLIGSEKTKENHNLLNESLANINEALSICNNNSFPKIDETIDDKHENLDFLKNSNESSLQVAKEDLDLYHSRYVSLSQQVNALAQDTSESFQNLSVGLNEFKDNIENMTEEFENTIKDIAVPLSVNQNNSVKILRILSFEESLKNYLQGIEKLNDFYNPICKNINEFSETLLSSVETIRNKIESLITKTKNGISNYVEILKVLTEETIHEKLKLIKDSFNYLVEDLNVLKRADENINKLKKILEDLKSIDFNDHNDIINNLKKISLELIKEGISGKINKIIFPFTTDSMLNILEDLAVYVNKDISYVEYLFEMVNVEVSTSLDLLFIMDITGSMGSYLEQAKNNILNIINDIIKKCPGIDINLGFIGYRDFYEEYTDIDFTQDHENLKRIISTVSAIGGGDFPEDVAFALDLALNKTWRSNARFAVFIADAPGHGIEYGGNDISSGTYPERRLLEELIAEMAEENISLFCLRINSATDKMLSIFEDVYNKIKSFNTKFVIVNNDYRTSFIDEVVNNAIEVYYEQRKNRFKECLIDKYSSNNILKSSYGISNSNPDDNLLFILGKCNPVLLVPGLYATKLVVEFNCKGIATEERSTTLKEIRLYCGDTVCKDETKTSEEHRLLFSLKDEAFSIVDGPIASNNKYSACLGHVANYFQNENECQKVKGKNTCFYSKYVKVGYYGGTKDTLKDSRCGVEGIINVVQSEDKVKDMLVNMGVSASFNKISKWLIYRGYKEGFSLGALPNDYRRYLATNNFATNVFKKQIDRLYKNTGKPVVIVAHSYGTLLTLTNLIKNQSDKNFMKKIKKFIAMAPPFAGSTKLLEIFLQGTEDFDIDLSIIKTKFDIFGQYMMYKSLPTAMELRPLSIASKIFTDSSYSELGDALRGRLEIERDCKTKDCDVSEIGKKTSNFDKIFKGYFPSLLDPECSYESYIAGDNRVLKRKCYTGIYNVGNCPTIVTKSVNPYTENFEKDDYCNKFGEKYFYQGECDDSKRNCIDQVYYSDKCPNVYSISEATNFLLNRFNNYFSKEYGTINNTYFDTHETIREGVKKSIEHQNSISLIKDLPVPPVDTELLYGSFYPTIASLVLDDNDFKNKEEKKIYVKGGDGTVPTWSSLLTGLKWVYDIKKKKLPQKIKLVEYCSRLAKSGQYKYDSNKTQNFAAIGCQCLDDSNVYKNDYEDCGHASMLQDENLILYIFSVVEDQNEINNISDIKKQAAKNYDPSFNYMEECSNDIFNILNTAK